MADRTIINRILAAFDRASHEKVGRQVEEALGKAGSEGGEKAGKGFLQELRNEFNKRKAQLQEQLARGIIDQKEFKRQTDIAAKTFNDGLLKGIEQARRQGTLTDREYVKLTRSIKRVGDAGERDIGRVNSSMERLRGIAIRVGAALASLWVVRRVAEYSKAVFQLGASVLAIDSQFEAVFGKPLSDRLLARTAELRSMAGLTTRQAKELFASAGAMGQGFGMAKEEAADFAEQVVRLSADLASFNEVPTAEAAQLVQSALIGNTEAARSLKVAFTAADVQSRALAMTGKATAKELTQEEKALAALAVMTERAGPMIGNLVQTQHEADNQAKQNAASYQEIKDRLAALLVEGLSVVPLFRNMRKGMEGVGDWIEDNQQAVRDLGTAIGGVANALLAMVQASVQAIGWLRRVQTGIDRFTARYGLTAAARGAAQARLRAALYEDEEDVDFGMGAGGTPPGETPEVPDTPEEGDQNAALRERIALLAKARDLNILTGGDIQEILRLEQETRDALAGQNPTLEQRVALWERLNTLEGLSAGLVGQVEAPVVGMVDSIVEGAETSKSAWLAAFHAMGEEAGAVSSLVQGIFGAWASGGIAGLGQLAKAKVLENIAWAIENFAKAKGWIALGNVPSAGAAADAASDHLKAAAAWGAAAGGAAVAGGGGGGGGGPSLSGPATQFAQNAQPSAEIHLYIDPLDPDSARWQNNVGAAYQNARDRWGNNARITVHPHPRGRA